MTRWQKKTTINVAPLSDLVTHQSCHVNCQRVCLQSSESICNCFALIDPDSFSQAHKRMTEITFQHNLTKQLELFILSVYAMYVHAVDSTH